MAGTGIPAVNNGNASWSPSSGSQLYNNRVKVAADEYIIEQNLTAKSTSSGDIATLQSQYNNDLSHYQADLEKDADDILHSPVDPSVATGGGRGGRFTPEQTAELKFVQDEKEAVEGKSQKFDYHKLTFTDSTAGSSNVGGAVDGTGFPGGQGDPEFFGATDLQKGYVSPPAISSGSDISEVYNNLDANQAAYLGWALQATETGKQVTIPAADLKSWNLLSEYAEENNHLLNTGNPDTNTGSIDEEVESSLQTNKPTDAKQVVLGAITGLFTLGLPTSVRGLIPGDAGTVLSGLAGILGGAITGVGFLGGDIEAAVTSAGTLSLGGAANDLANIVTSLRNVLGADGLSEAGGALLMELGENGSSLLSGSTVDSFTLNDTFNKPAGG